MRIETSGLALAGIVGALTVGLLPAQGAPVVAGIEAPTLAPAPILVGGDKIGVDAGAAVGGGGAGTGVSADVDAGPADVDADVGASTDGSASTGTDAGTSGDAGTDTGTSAGTSGGASTDSDASAGGGVSTDSGTSTGTSGTVGTGADAGTGGTVGTDTGADVGASGTVGTNTGTDVGTSADGTAGATVGGGTGASVDTSSGVNAGAAATGDATGSVTTETNAPSTAVSSPPADGAGQASATAAPAPLAASASAAVPPAGSAPAVTSVVPGSLPPRLIVTGSHNAQGAVDASARVRSPEADCVELTDKRTGICIPPGKSTATRQAASGGVAAGLSGTNDGAARLPAPAAAPPAVTQAAAMPQPAARTGAGLGISLTDPVRQNGGLLVQGVIVNGGTQPQAIPAMQVTLSNSENQVVQQSIVKAPGVTIRQGQRKSFKTFVDKLPPNVSRVTVAFIASE